jgi:hypothetical protein
MPIWTRWDTIGHATEATGKPMGHARRSKYRRTPSCVPAEGDGSAIEATEGSSSPAWSLCYLRTPISTLPEPAGNANGASARATNRANLSRSLARDSSGVRATNGNAIAVIGSATNRASRSRCLLTATWTRRDVTGIASEASRKDLARARRSGCRCTLTSITREADGLAIRAIGSEEKLVPRTRNRGAAPRRRRNRIAEIAQHERARRAKTRRGAGVKSAPPCFSAGGDRAHFPRAASCCDHSFDDALVCRCGVSWWAHQWLPKTCPLNARGRNRGEDAVRRHS